MDPILVMLIATVVTALFLATVVRASGVVRYIPNDRVGVVERLWSTAGAVEDGFIALGGETGFQPDVLRGGWHAFLPFQARLHVLPLVTIPQGKLGYVFARDGRALQPSQILASNEVAADFSDVRAFLAAGGQKGPQRKILREGTYALNLAQFVVITDDRILCLPMDAQEMQEFRRMQEVLQDRDGFRPVVIGGDTCGAVTVQDGPALDPGEIIAPTVGADPSVPATFHNDFQDPEAFLRAGGRRGRQLQMLVEGTFAINRLFATIETVPKTVIEVGHVGVVVSYTGARGEDLSGDEYAHGELVRTGERGVWAVPLMPGKYAFNPFAGKVVAVPTTNIILKWIRNQTGSHKLDENLSEVSLITRDAYEPSLPLSVVVHIDYRKAPLVIQRFGDIRRLVEQTLDPMVAAYFKNIGQMRTLIELLQERAAIQTEASQQMREKFSRYNLELEEVLIGTPTSTGVEIEEILHQLRARQLADEQIETYQRQERAAKKERELREAEARAKAQNKLTESEVAILVQGNEGRAEFERSVQKANQIRTLADAEADKVRAMAAADADRVARVGVAEAVAIGEQVRAYGGPRTQVVQQVMGRFATAIEQAKVEVVPRVVVGDTNGAGLLDAVMGMLLSDELVDDGVAGPPDEAAASLRTEILDAARKQRKAS